MQPNFATTWAVCISTIGGVVVACAAFAILQPAFGQQPVPVLPHPVSDASISPDPLRGRSVVSIQNGASLLDNALGNPTPDQSGPGLPVRLKIPSINVDSIIEYVGLTPEGVMDVPNNRDDVGWLKLGLRPGQQGSAVIAGHYGTLDGTGSVFDKLHTLRKGDKIVVEDDLGAHFTFVVRETRRFNSGSDAAQVFGSTTADDKGSHLNLITCEGIWNDAENGFPTRLVVFTDRETP